MRLVLSNVKLTVSSLCFLYFLKKESTPSFILSLRGNDVTSRRRGRLKQTPSFTGLAGS